MSCACVICPIVFVCSLSHIAFIANKLKLCWVFRDTLKHNTALTIVHILRHLYHYAECSKDIRKFKAVRMLIYKWISINTTKSFFLCVVSWYRFLISPLPPVVFEYLKYHWHMPILRSGSCKSLADSSGCEWCFVYLVLK